MLEKYLNYPIEELKKIYASDAQALEALAILLYKNAKNNQKEFLEFLPVVENSTCANALFYYGLFFYSEKQEMEKAAALFEKSALLSHPYAQYCYGSCLFYGEGVQKDVTKGLAFITLSASEKNEQAIGKLAEIYFYGEEVDVNYQMALYYYNQLPDLTLSIDAYNKGLCYEKLKDPANAILCYKKAGKRLTEFNSISSFTDIFIKNCLLDSTEDCDEEKSTSLSTNHERAFLAKELDRLLNGENQFDKILNTQSEYSNRNYVAGRMHELGINTKKDFKKAIEFYQLASKQGHPTALYRLGYFYERGIEVEKNLSTAQNFYRLSSIGGYEREKYAKEKNFEYLPTSSEKAKKRGLTVARVKYAKLFEDTIPELVKVAKNSDIIKNNEQAHLLTSEDFYLKLARAEYIVAFNFSNGGKYETQELALFHLRHPEFDEDKTYFNMLDKIKVYSTSVELLKYYNQNSLQENEDLIFNNIKASTDLDCILDCIDFYNDEFDLRVKSLREQASKLGDEYSTYILAVNKLENGDKSALKNLKALEDADYEKARTYLIDYYVNNFHQNEQEFLPPLEDYAKQKVIKVIELLLNYDQNNENYLLIALSCSEFKERYKELKQLLANVYDSRFDFESALKYTYDIPKKNLYKIILNKIDTFSSEDELISQYFNFKKLLVYTTENFEESFNDYRKEILSTKLFLRQAELIEYLLKYENSLPNDINFDLINLIKCTLLDESAIIQRGVKEYPSSKKCAIALLNLVKDHPASKYNQAIIEYDNAKKINIFAKSKIIKQMELLQNDFYPAYLWLKANCAKKAVKPTNDNYDKQLLLK